MENPESFTFLQFYNEWTNRLISEVFYRGWCVWLILLVSFFTRRIFSVQFSFNRWQNLEDFNGLSLIQVSFKKTNKKKEQTRIYEFLKKVFVHKKNHLKIGVLSTFVLVSSLVVNGISTLVDNSIPNLVSSLSLSIYIYIGRTRSGAATPGQSGPESDGNEGVLRIPQRSNIREAYQQIA